MKEYGLLIVVGQPTLFHELHSIVQINILTIGTLNYYRVSCILVVWYGMCLLPFCDLSLCDVMWLGVPYKIRRSVFTGLL